MNNLEEIVSSLNSMSIEEKIDTLLKTLDTPIINRKLPMELNVLIRDIIVTKEQ